MKYLMRLVRGRLVRLLGACALLTGAIGVTAAGTAQAVTCGGATLAGTTCTITGTLSLTSGSLTLTAPSALGWGALLTGLDQQLVDTTTAHQSYLVDDATGTGAGWHVTASATTFAAGNATLPDVGTFVTTGSVTSETATTAPTAACSSGASCILPTNATTYPVAITTASSSPTAVNIYDAAGSTGAGSITIGIGANPVGWWVTVPATAQPFRGG
jgi:hypothetical protein